MTTGNQSSLVAIRAQGLLAAGAMRSLGDQTAAPQRQEDTNMRKSIIAGLMLSAAAVLLAGQALAEPTNTRDGAPSTYRSHHKHHPRIAETPPPASAQLFRIPAHPLVWDCVHVMFPQCSRGYEPLNDGTRGRY
jgi:hypothetical protein